MSSANNISLEPFLSNLAEVFDGDMEIEKTARRELRKVSQANFTTQRCTFPAAILYHILIPQKSMAQLSVRNSASI